MTDSDFNPYLTVKPSQQPTFCVLYRHELFQDDQMLVIGHQPKHRLSRFPTSQSHRSPSERTSSPNRLSFSR